MYTWKESRVQTNRRLYLDDAEYFEQYWDSVYEQEYKYRPPTELDYSVADVKFDEALKDWKDEHDD